MSTPTALLPFRPATRSTAQLAAFSFLARYSERSHHLYQFQLREWFAWCERNGPDPLIGVQRAHVELSIRSLGERGLMDSSVVSMMNGGRGLFTFRAHRRPHPGRPGRVRPGCRRSSAPSPEPKAWTGSS